MPVGKLDHYSIRTIDIEASRRFYTEIMGFKVGFRPAFDFPGLCLYNGAGQVTIELNFPAREAQAAP